MYYLSDVATTVVLLMVLFTKRLRSVRLTSVLTRVSLVLGPTRLFKDAGWKAAYVVLVFLIFIVSFLLHRLTSWLVLQ